MTTTKVENYYIAKYVQFTLEDQTKVVLHAEDDYYTNKNIARFNFLTMEGWYYTVQGKQIEVKRFSTIMNYFFKLDEYFGWDDKLVAQAKLNAKQIKLEESKLYQLELKEKSEQKAIHFMTEFLTGEQATKLQAMELEELKVLIKNTFKYASKKTLKTVLDSILNFDIVELNTHETTVINEDTVQVETTNQTTDDPSYTVGNRTFKSYNLALDYCNSNDFDADTMIIQEVASVQPSSIDNEPVVYYFYKQVFNTYMEAYNYALKNMSPVTMILPSNHPTMNNERLKELEHEYTFSKMNMPYDNMVEYFDYISELDETIDMQDRFYKLKGWIERYENKMNECAENKRILHDKMKTIGDMITDLKSIGMTIKENESYVKYYLNNEEIYIWFTGITIEKQYAGILEVYDRYYTSQLVNKI